MQEAWLRWDGIDRSRIDNAEAFLTTVVTRLALDRLRRAKARRETYTGPWLPEPIAVDADPAAAAELADSLSMALLVVLETLSPLERAAFVLREVFQVPYAEVAETLGREEPAVRQLVHRARQRVDDGRARFQADRATHTATVQAFVAACASADLDALLAVLSPDVVAIGDGGGVARAPRRPVHGPDKVGRLMLGITAKASPDLAYGFEMFNGRIGIVARQGRPGGRRAVLHRRRREGVDDPRDGQPRQARRPRPAGPDCSDPVTTVTRNHVMSGHDHPHRRRGHPRTQRAETLDHRQAAVLLRGRRRPRLGHLCPRRAGRRRRRRGLLDGLPRRLGDRPHHRPRVRRAGHQVPAGGRRLALHQQGVPHPDPDVLHHHLHALGQLRRRGGAVVELRALLRRAGRDLAGVDLDGDHRGADLHQHRHAHQPDRHHRVGRSSTSS